jgi:pimeloyl-ACP methyl ester carboxylesterase
MTTRTEYTIPGIHVREHELRVPLDWNNPDGDEITVFARELVAPERRAENLPPLLYLEGGPGGKAPRPVTADGWIGQALQKFRVVLLDQRGTGRSSRIDSAVISTFESAEAGAVYLTHFRADSIVRDAEALRTRVFGGVKWVTLGQSYGGFITLAYLSRAPEALAACLVAGGLASVTPDAREVYRRTYPRVELKNRLFYRRYPQDVDTLARIADRIAVGDVQLPDGDLLTVRRLQSLGIDFGMKPGFERIHWLIDEAFRHDSDELSDAFLQQVQQLSSFAGNPLFAVMQESIYGSGSGATGWAAQAEREEHPEFAEAARPLLLTGEMMYPWMFSEIKGLRAFEPAVNALARREEWSELYDLERLAANDVPVVAAVYFDDMYVDSGLQLETARRVGNLHPWVTNEYEHDGIGADRVFQHLISTLADNGGAKTDD